LEKRDGVTDTGVKDAGVANKKGKAMKKLLSVIIPAMLLLCFSALNTATAENSLIQQYREAQKLENEGMCEEAIFAYQDILLENRFYIDARIGLARCYYTTGKLRLARDTITQALEQEEKNVEAWILLGRINTSLREYEEAKSAFDRVRAIEPANIEVRYRIGDLYRAQGSYREAIAHYKDMIKLYPRDVMAYIYLGIVYTEMGELEKAGGYFRKAVSLNSDDPLTHLNLARHYYRMGVLYTQRQHAQGSSPTALIHREEAAEYFEAGITEARTAIVILNESYKKAKSFLLEKKIAEAYRIISSFHFYMARTTPQNESELRRKHWEQAIEAFEPILSLIQSKPEPGEGDWLVYYELAFCQEMSGDMENALKNYEKSWTLRVDGELTRFRLENLLLKRYGRDLDNAKRVLHSDHHYKKGRFDLEEHLMDKAFMHYKRAVMLDPTNPEKRVSLADLFRRRKFYEQYLVELRDIIQGTLDVDSIDIQDRIEIYESRVGKNLAAQWSVRQYERNTDSPYHVAKSKVRVAVLNAFESDYINRDFVHMDFSHTFTEMLNLVLTYYDKIEVLPLYRDVFRSHDAIPEIHSARQALREARSLSDRYRVDVDYYVTGRIVEQTDSLKVHVKIYSAFNGTLVHELATFYTGNDRVFNTVVSIASSINQFVPLRGMIVRMEGRDRALINLGRAHGVKPGMVFHIIKEESLQVSPETGEYQFDPQVSLGTLTVTRVDEMVAEGTYAHEGRFNRVNQYDRVVLQEPEGEDEEESGNQ
jgi:tetratricopeptide (TPR) repeat protein